MSNNVEDVLRDLAATHRPVWSSSDLDYFVAQRGAMTPRAARRLVQRFIALGYIKKVEDGFYTIKVNKETLDEAKARIREEYNNGK